MNVSYQINDGTWYFLGLPEEQFLVDLIFSMADGQDPDGGGRGLVHRYQIWHQHTYGNPHLELSSALCIQVHGTPNLWALIAPNSNRPCPGAP